MSGTVRIGVVGTGWWGMNILGEAVASNECQVVALCDVDGNALEVASDQVNSWTGDSPKTYKDHRELLEKEKPEIVIIATPDHWHALQTIDAVKAGSLEPGQAGTVRTLRVHLVSGHYLFFCNMAGHYLGGMNAEVIVP